MKTIIDFNLDELFRYLLSIVFFILSLRLMLTPEMVPSFSVFENFDNERIVLGIAAIIATAMFVFQKTKVIGGILLLLIFAYGAFHHITTIGGIPGGLIFCTVSIIFILLVDVKRKSLEAGKK